MHQRFPLQALAVLLCALVGTAVTAHANLATYTFQESTGSRYDMSGASVLYHGDDVCEGVNVDDNSTTAENIGFTFIYDGVAYTKYSVSTNGLIGLFRSWGSTSVTSCWTNDIDATTGGCFGQYSYTLDSVPQFGAFWDDLRVANLSCRGSDPTDGVISTKLFGTAPNRVRVIDFDDVEFDYYNYRYADWQIRIYEGTNRIEFWYGGFGSEYEGDGGTIGLGAVGGASFMSVTPGSGASTSSTNDFVNPTTIRANTLYTFNPCNLQLTGNTSQGGTATMAAGDTLLRGTTVQVGSTGSFQPFTFRLDVSPCTNRTYSIEITGRNASEFSVDPTSGTVSAGGSVSPTITWTPRCAGTSPVTMRVTGNDGLDRTYTILPTATAQASWTGNVSQGGTASLTSGDTLLGSAVVLRGSTATFRPITISNLNTSASATPLNVTFSITDPSGQYSVDPTATSLGSGGTVSPVITFNALGVSYQEATLAVSDGCETRTFLLRAFSAAPGGELTVDKELLDSSVALFRGTRACVGAGAVSQAITITNTGYGDFILTGIEVYETDTLIAQGTGPYPVRRDAFGNPVASPDYLITLSPGTAPLTPSQAVALPYAVPQGQSRTIYITYVGTEPGRRYARVFIRTNGQNLVATDVNGNRVEGLVRFDVVAGSIGARIAANASGRPLRAVVFPNTSLGDTAVMSVRIANAGACDLRIARAKLAIFSGDVHEFKILSVFPGRGVDAFGDYVIAPGDSDVVVVQFTPSRSGTRMATMWIQTNDSTLHLPGLTERGSIYVDLHGYGRAGLEGANLTLAPVLIGGLVEGTVVLENASTVPVEVGSISIVGGDAAEFGESVSTPWPTLPRTVLPGERLRLNVQLQPTGTAGIRRTTMQLVTTMGDTVIVGISGEAGTRELSVTPTTLFTDVNIAVGQQVRRTVQISNTGSFPIRLQAPTITGTDSANYRLGQFPRLDLMPGQTEYLEVTFAPSTQGVSSAQIDIMGTGGSATVTLGGEASSAFGGDDADPDRGVAGIGRDAITGTTFSVAVAPNPADASAALTVVTGATERLTLTLHDTRGGVVLREDLGVVAEGRHAFPLDLGTLPSGRYTWRLTGEVHATSGTLTIVR